MPRPIPIPIRQAMFRLWRQGHGSRDIAVALGLARSTVRHLLARFRRQGSEGIAPDYGPPAVVEASSSDVELAALRLRREHPTWGAGLIQVQLVQGMPGRSVPTERTLQRWFGRADLSPAPAGRRPRVDLARATMPHETWQMDAKEHIRIQTRDEVSWFRLTDECSGAVLWTAVFPPRDLGPCSCL
jgi:transposase